MFQNSLKFIIINIISYKHVYYIYNVEVTLAMWVSIQDLKKPLNTEFSIGPKSVTIMIPGCQYKNSVPKLRPFFQITNNYQNYHYIYIYNYYLLYFEVQQYLL